MIRRSMSGTASSRKVVELFLNFSFSDDSIADVNVSGISSETETFEVGWNV